MDTMATLIDQSQLKRAFSCLAAGTSVVTLMDLDGTKMGLTATAVTSVSVDPPLVLVCINNYSPTIPALQAGAPFVINFLRQEQQWIGTQFATRGVDKFANVEYLIGEYGGLYLTGTLASLECVPHDIHPAGDHHIVVGRVVDLTIGDDASPLVFYRSRFLS